MSETSYDEGMRLLQRSLLPTRSRAKEALLQCITYSHAKRATRFSRSSRCDQDEGRAVSAVLGEVFANVSRRRLFLNNIPPAETGYPLMCNNVPPVVSGIVVALATLRN